MMTATPNQTMDPGKSPNTMKPSAVAQTSAVYSKGATTATGAF